MQILSRRLIQKDIYKSSFYMLFGLLCQWLITEYKEIIPRYVGGINVHGLLLILLIVFIYTNFFKNLLKQDDRFTIPQLTIDGILVFFIAQTVFQIFRQVTFVDYTFGERVHYFMLGVFGTTVFAAVIAFLTAFQIKTRNTRRLFLFIAIFLAITWFIKEFNLI